MNESTLNIEKPRKRTAGEWLKQHARQQVSLCLLGAVGLLLVSVICHYITYWAFWMFLLRFRLFHLDSIQLGATIALIAIHPLYLLIDRESLEKVELEPAGRRLGAIVIGRALGWGMMGAFAGPKTFLTYIRMLTQIFLIAPGVFWTAIRLIRWAWRWHTMDVERVGKMVHCLYTEETKISADVLLGSDVEDGERATSLIQQLTLIDGVLILRENELGFALGSELRRDISRWRKKKK